MRCKALAFLTCFLMPMAIGKTISKTEIVEELEKTEVKNFCSKNNEKDSLSLCEKWLDRQSKSLGERLLTSYCSQGDLSSDPSCLYKTTGELKYVLRKHRIDTDKD